MGLVPSALAYFRSHNSQGRLSNWCAKVQRFVREGVLFPLDRFARSMDKTVDTGGVGSRAPAAHCLSYFAEAKRARRGSVWTQRCSIDRSSKSMRNGCIAVGMGPLPLWRSGHWRMCDLSTILSKKIHAGAKFARVRNRIE